MDIFARGSGIADIEEAIPFRFICNEFWKSRSQSIQRCIWILQRTLEIGSLYQFLPHPPFLCPATHRWNIWPHKFQPKRNQWKQFLFSKVPQTTNLFDEFERSWPWSQKKKNSEWLLAVTFALMDQPNFMLIIITSVLHGLLPLSLHWNTQLKEEVNCGSNS